MTPTDAIFIALKKQGPLSKFQLCDYTGLTPSVVSRTLTDMIEAGWIYLDADHEKYAIRRPLLPPMNDSDRLGLNTQFYKYENILEGEPAPPLESLMPEDHPFKKYLPHGWDQFSQMNCVGMATAVLQQVNYLSCTEDYPLDDEISMYARNIQVRVGDCTMTYDIWYHSIFSAWWAYRISQIVGGVTGAGSYSSASIQAWKEYGGVPWDSCLTPKTMFCAPEYPLDLEELTDLAEPHKIDGYATVTTWEGLKTAITSNPSLPGMPRGAIMPINMYETAPDSNNNLLAVGKVIGAHSLPWLFVDREGDRVGCWNSWGPGYPQVTWINQEYWSKAAGKAFVPLDHEEAKIARSIYCLISVEANATCKFTVNGESRPELQSFSFMAEKGKNTVITAVPIKPEDYTEPSQTREITTQQSKLTVTFTFTRKDPGPTIPHPGGGMPPWARDLFARLKNAIKKVMIWRSAPVNLSGKEYKKCMM